MIISIDAEEIDKSIFINIINYQQTRNRRELPNLIRVSTKNIQLT